MRRSRVVGPTICLFLALSLSPVAMASDQESDYDGSETNTVHVWFPSGDFYPRYIADPTRPQNALTLQWLADSEIPDTGAGRFGLRLGGLLGIHRWHPEREPDSGWQISFEGGFGGQFDMEHQLDVTGWDGFFGLYLDWMLSSELGFRIGTQHDSSHVGDEYSRRTGRDRIEYTREEIVLGVSWRFSPRWRTYGEVGYGGGLDDEGPWGLQTGLELVSERKYWQDRASRFAAFDVRIYEESDWSARFTVQAGYWIPVGDRSSIHRVAVELGIGRSVMGQFLWQEETWIGVGWYYDF